MDVGLMPSLVEPPDVGGRSIKRETLREACPGQPARLGVAAGPAFPTCCWLNCGVTMCSPPLRCCPSVIGSRRRGRGADRRCRQGPRCRSGETRTYRQDVSTVRSLLQVVAAQTEKHRVGMVLCAGIGGSRTGAGPPTADWPSNGTVNLVDPGHLRRGIGVSSRVE